jgi:hypothetical protein
MIKNVYWSSCKVAVILVTFQLKLNLLSKFSKNIEISDLMKMSQVGAELFHADGQTDMTQPIVAIRNSTKAPNNNNKKRALFQLSLSTAVVKGCRVFIR